MEEATELANYLPLSFKTPKEQEYIEFLWDAFEQKIQAALARVGGEAAPAAYRISPCHALFPLLQSG